MKIIASTVLVALFAATQGRFLDATVANTMTAAQVYPSYASTLNCGACIGSGNTYCIQKAENTPLNAFMTGTSQQTCIASGTNDGKMSDATWSCSNAFNDRVYSKYVCQFNTAACGHSSGVITLANTTSTAQVNITGLAAGQTCFYRVQAACGAPAFKPTNATNLEIEYVEFRQAETNATGVDPIVGYTLGSMSTVKRQAAPLSTLPRRDHFFTAEVGGNSISNANSTTHNVTVNGTIWGKSGRYDKTAGKTKAYGNPTQGDVVQGLKTNAALDDCLPRNVYLAVTAVNNVDTALARVDFSVVSFYKAPATDAKSGASILSITFAAVLGLISLAFF